MAARFTMSGRAKKHLSQWYDENFLESAVVLKGSFFGWLFGLFGQHAVTLNRKVHITRRAPDLNENWGIALLGHEFFHVEQQQQMGWWNFLLRYSLKWRPKHITDGTNHPMEKPAYARGLEVWKAFAPGGQQAHSQELER